MEKELVLSRLQDTVNMLENLKEHEFNFSTWVTKGEEGCGTVCCVGGWYPKYFPESGIRWTTDGAGLVDPQGVKIRLADWHGLPQHLIWTMFADGIYKIPNDSKISGTYISYECATRDVTLDMVRIMFKLVKKFVEEDKIPLCQSQES